VLPDIVAMDVSEDVYVTVKPELDDASKLNGIGILLYVFVLIVLKVMV
jgi:hypothetical protein